MKTFVIHPEKLTERGKFIECMLRGLGIEYEFINEGTDGKQIEAYLNRYMRNGTEMMLQKSGRSLCTLSHFLAYERILSDGLDGALILEDDIVLRDNFVPHFEQSIREYERNYKDSSVLISYEDSSLRFVPRSQRERGRMLYEERFGRMAGAYYINRCAAQAIISHLEEEHCDIAIDLYHNQLFDAGIVSCLWCQPTLATQGSFTGKFHSSLSKKKDWMIELRWYLKKNYKRLLYWFR